jgi:hypothetical protein
MAMLKHNSSFIFVQRTPCIDFFIYFQDNYLLFQFLFYVTIEFDKYLLMYIMYNILLSFGYCIRRSRIKTFMVLYDILLHKLYNTKPDEIKLLTLFYCNSTKLKPLYHNL